MKATGWDLIGPNGSGKSTLLEILAQRREPDTGEVVMRKGTRMAYLAQESQFAPGETVRAVIQRALERAGVPESRTAWSGSGDSRPDGL